MKLQSMAVLATVTFSSIAWSQQNYVEIGPAYTITENEIFGETDNSSGGGLSGRSRLFVEGAAFIQFDAQAGFTDGEVLDTDYEVDLSLYRLGLGAAGGVGDGNIMSAVWAEIVHGRSEVDIAGIGGDDDSEWGGGIHLRFDRYNDSAIFLPYFEIGYLFLEELDGPEARLGARLNYSTWAPYAEVQYIDLDAGSEPGLLSFRPIVLHVGVRITF